MIFCDFYGPEDIYRASRERLRSALAHVMRSTEQSVVVRRILVEDDRPEVEMWVELSTEEQRYRLAETLARDLSATIREQFPVDVWVMFRVVPLSNAFLNGQSRARGGAAE